MLVLMMVPMFGNLNKTMETISGFLFTGVLQQTVVNISQRKDRLVNGLSIAVIAVEIVAAVVCFLVIYRRNGYDSQ